jgi:hypothetical protein
MNHIIRSVFVISLIALYACQGYSQINLQTFSGEQKMFTIISPLDLLAKLPASKTLSTKKQRSIFDAEKLPFFCRFEHKLSQKSKLNVRMRLGSLDYVNKLEGKN